MTHNLTNLNHLLDSSFIINSILKPLTLELWSVKCNHVASAMWKLLHNNSTHPRFLLNTPTTNPLPHSLAIFLFFKLLHCGIYGLFVQLQMEWKLWKIFFTLQAFQTQESLHRFLCFCTCFTNVFKEELENCCWQCQKIWLYDNFNIEFNIFCYSSLHHLATICVSLYMFIRKWMNEKRKAF